MAPRTLKTSYVINVLGAVVPLVVSLITVPIYVRHIGDARYGLLSIVWALLGYFGFLDFGLSRAAANAMAKLRGARQDVRAQVLVTSLILNLVLGMFGAFCLAVLGEYSLRHFIAIPDVLIPEIDQAFPWIVGLLPMALISGVGIGALESRERFLLANVLQAGGTSIGQIVPVILAVAVSPSLAVVIPAAALARALTVVAVLIAVYHHEGPLSLAAFDRGQVRKLLSYGGWVTVSSVISPILISIDQVLIGAMVGVAAVAHYAVPMNLVTRSQVFAGALVRTLFPRLSSSSPMEARSLASRALMALAYGYGVVCAPAIILTPIFFRFWISADFASIAAPAAEILFFGAWVNALAFVPYFLLQSQGRPDVTGKLHAAEVLPFVAIIWGLTSAIGVAGAATAWDLRCAADALFLCWAAGISRRDFIRSLPPFFVMGGSAAIGRATGSNLWEGLAAATATGVVSVVLACAMVDDFRNLAISAKVRAARLLWRSPPSGALADGTVAPR
jgi:O-antigen/teichoic acid export membrane protein